MAMDLHQPEELTPRQVELIEHFQCPGCVAGMDVTCGACKVQIDYGINCRGHVTGTHIGLGNPVALGLPKGFHKPGFHWDDKAQDFRHNNQMNIRIWEKGTAPSWDNLNIPVWALSGDDPCLGTATDYQGYLFVRTYSPRVNVGYVDVIEGGTLDMVPQAINVGEFYEDFD